MNSKLLPALLISTGLFLTSPIHAEGGGSGAGGRGHGGNAKKKRHHPEHREKGNNDQGDSSNNQARNDWRGRSDRDDFSGYGTKGNPADVDHREHRQKERIKQGTKSGQLTKEETKSLAEEQKSIRQEEKEYRSDGEFTKEERKDVQQDLKEASKDIYQEKHDEETREGVTPAEPKAPGTRDPGVNSRQENQEDRIKQGVASGELTKAEAKKLARREAELARVERKLKEDGSLSAKERAALQKKLDRLNKEIYKQKHDGQSQKED